MLMKINGCERKNIETVSDKVGKWKYVFISHYCETEVKYSEDM